MTVRNGMETQLIESINNPIITNIKGVIIRLVYLAHLFSLAFKLNWKLYRGMSLEIEAGWREGIGARSGIWPVLWFYFNHALDFIGIAGAPVLNVPRTGSNSCLRATRRKCARIFLPVQGVFLRDTFTILAPVILFPSVSFSLSRPSSFPLFLCPSLPLPLILPARRLIISRTTHNFTSNTSRVCLTAFFAPTKLFSCVTPAPLCTLQLNSCTLFSRTHRDWHCETKLRIIQLYCDSMLQVIANKSS